MNESSATKKAKVIESEASPYNPQKARIIGERQMTTDTKLFELELETGERLGQDPGQFVELSIPGVGEAPISVTSSPTRGLDSFELCVRAVGNVTNALHEMNIGETVGIRGPFGNGFPVNELQGKDLLFIAGGLGIAPLRSLINYTLDRRDKFNDLNILYGCKRPCEQMFEDEVDHWARRQDIYHETTVDFCPDNVCWGGNIGVITELIPGVDIDLENTYAIVCGPPVMYKFVLQELDEKELPHEHIYLSLERRMKCGLGKCGHCQINGAEEVLYACQDGPVFNYEKVKGFEEAI